VFENEDGGVVKGLAGLFTLWCLVNLESSSGVHGMDGFAGRKGVGQYPK
jgi:hypothetical protein